MSTTLNFVNLHQLLRQGVGNVKEAEVSEVTFFDAVIMDETRL